MKVYKEDSQGITKAEEVTCPLWASYVPNTNRLKEISLA